MRKVGKKGLQWRRERAKIIKRAIKEGRIETNEQKHILGYCEDCGKYKHLTPDHIHSRGTGGKDTYENIAWVCLTDHQKRDQQGDPMKKKKKSPKADWSKEHKCKSCKELTSMFLCHHCHNPSV